MSKLSQKDGHVFKCCFQLVVSYTQPPILFGYYFKVENATFSREKDVLAYIYKYQSSSTKKPTWIPCQPIVAEDVIESISILWILPLRKYLFLSSLAYTSSNWNFHLSLPMFNKAFAKIHAHFYDSSDVLSSHNRFKPYFCISVRHQTSKIKVLQMPFAR